jgi:tRNA pseudouridine55 synthase
MQFSFIEGEVLFINKPLNWTSFDVVNKIRYLISRSVGKKIKVGHAGTLDPLATGLVIICTGKKTKEITKFQDYEKEYIATIKIGETTPSFDLETEIDNTFDVTGISNELIKEAIQSFIGEQFQVAPAFSAKKIDGKRAYIKARKGIEVEIKPSLINIRNIEILDIDFPKVKIKVNCSKGTYIRSIARDLGVKLHSGAHLIELERTKIGEFNLNNSLSIEDFEKIITSLHNKVEK